MARTTQHPRPEPDSLPALAYSDPRFAAAQQFLTREAFLLDHGRFHEWMEMLDQDLEYRMPVRVTAWRADGEGFTDAMHFDDTYASMQGRVARLDTGYAWGEDPPSRTRRFISNITVTAPTHDDHELHVVSYLLVARSRWDNPTYQFLSAERRDLLRQAPNHHGKYKLLNREILVDQSNLGTVNLAIFL
ncbi:3-phenylpropionate/cinnamic acid dioxygenase subunit beta [Mycobacterium vicinigordonae]|uniref:3-phenylpropionate/cinnamic acid dioxygenase subunit beta n=2 Tax=Mycobacterium vicinigordonae TaxID=1719132 RepID=A0A7D6HUM7_9MYCO|nr:3-phenylpropionate/cinnamic acid dioxygenase subunit beta [Mycobacterium vicinigordonae]QLL10392.1 3-phenylpropionate/cinnamic acid dioxygenase subunit beta [Mycobacterium vicinigordonae]